MPTLQVEFRITLSDAQYDFAVNGPRFHRWLPDGQQDAIDLLVLPDGTRLQAWFERFGVTQDGFISFTTAKREVDPGALECQGHVDAGPLYARLCLDVDDGSLTALRERMAKYPRTGPPPDKEPPELEMLARRILKLVYEPLSRFVDLLRITYGQGWLRTIRPFDSREESCLEYVEGRLGARQWSTDGTTWERFPGGTYRMTLQLRSAEDYRRYLKREDWRQLQNLVAEGASPSVGAQLLARAVHLHDTGHMSEAFVQAVAGLEVITGEFVQEQKARGTDMKRLIPRFDGLGRRGQLAVCALVRGLPPVSLEHALDAVELRNKIVHEGMHVSAPLDQEQRAALFAAVEVGSALCPSSQVRLVELFSANTARAPEAWDAEK